MVENNLNGGQSRTMPKCDPIAIPFLIVTQNLIIRPLIKQDKKEVSDAIHESLKSLHMWLPSSEKVPSEDEYYNICTNFYTEAEEQTAYHFVVYQNEKFMGMCSLLEVSLAKNTAKLNYWCRSNSDNQNYFIEAINGLLRYALETSVIKAIYIDCVVGNFVNELAAKELNFKLQAVDIINGSQIKLYKIDNKDKLPQLATYSVVN